MKEITRGLLAGSDIEVNILAKQGPQLLLLCLPLLMFPSPVPAILKETVRVIRLFLFPVTAFVAISASLLAVVVAVAATLAVAATATRQSLRCDLV